jgi:hypothetical protein
VELSILGRLTVRGLVILASLITVFLGVEPTAISRKPPTIEFLGHATVASSVRFQGQPLGGLSGITYDPKRHVYYAISDDRSQKAPARFYTLKINLVQGRLTANGIQFISLATLVDRDQTPFEPGQIDAEGIALSNLDQLWISSEGDANQLISPFVRSFDLTGQPLQALKLPDAYLPNPDQGQGISNNRAFESLTITPDGRSLITATENALLQDGTEANENQGTPCRVLRYNLAKKRVEGEFIYVTEPATATPNSKSSLVEKNGLVELIALNNQHRFLSLERAFNISTGFQVKLFDVSLKNVTNIQGQTKLDPVALKTQDVAKKTLLLDLQSLPVPLDNLEGMTLGPQLPDGRQLLVMVSDNNFNPLQITQFLAFALDLP